MVPYDDAQVRRGPPRSPSLHTMLIMIPPYPPSSIMIPWVMKTPDDNPLHS